MDDLLFWAVCCVVVVALSATVHTLATGLDKLLGL